MSPVQAMCAIIYDHIRTLLFPCIFGLYILRSNILVVTFIVSKPYLINISLFSCPQGSAVLFSDFTHQMFPHRGTLDPSWSRHRVRSRQLNKLLETGAEQF